MTSRVLTKDEQDKSLAVAIHQYQEGLLAHLHHTNVNRPPPHFITLDYSAHTCTRHIVGYILALLSAFETELNKALKFLRCVALFEYLLHDDHIHILYYYPKLISIVASKLLEFENEPEVCKQVLVWYKRLHRDPILAEVVPPWDARSTLKRFLSETKCGLGFVSDTVKLSYPFDKNMRCKCGDYVLERERLDDCLNRSAQKNTIHNYR